MIITFLVSYFQCLLCSHSYLWLPPDLLIFLTSKHQNASELVLAPPLFSLYHILGDLTLSRVFKYPPCSWFKFISPDLTSSLNSKFKYLLLDISNLRFRKLNFYVILHIYLSQSPFLINGNSVLLFAHTKILESYLISQEKDLSHPTCI